MTPTSKFTLVPRIDTYPRVVRFAQSSLGKLTVLAIFAVGLRLHGKPWWSEMTAMFAATTFWPARRRGWIILGTSYWLFRHTVFQWSVVREASESFGVATLIDWRILEPAAIVAVLLFCAGFIYLARQRARIAPMRRPIVCLFAACLALALAADSSAISGVTRVWLWAFLVVLTRYVWFLCYALIYPEPGRGPLLQVGQFLPFWYGAATTPNPIPKGAGYLQKIEVKSAEELAVCQLKAIKLLFWAGVLAAIHKLCVDTVGGSGAWSLPALGLRIPAAVEALADSVSGRAPAAYLSCLALLWRFTSSLLVLSIWGHIVVACCRMSGFKALRNTCRPLESTSIADFWNRYFFYFKEVLVDVFFYPTFLRYFKGRPRLRLFVATLAAATFGNVLFHYVRDVELAARLGLWGALLAKQTYIVYALLLGVGIGVSQLRSRRRAGAVHWTRRRILQPALVVGFYCLLSVFEIEGPATISQRLAFLPTLIGIHLP
jgi:hypothetical protein